MSEWEAFLVFVILVEGIVTVLTQLYKPEEGKLWWQSVQWKMMLAIAVSVGVAFAAKITVFELAGVPLSPAWLDYVLSGFLASRGAAYVYELTKLVKEVRIRATTEAETEQRYLYRSESSSAPFNEPGP